MKRIKVPKTTNYRDAKDTYRNYYDGILFADVETAKTFMLFANVDPYWGVTAGGRPLALIGETSKTAWPARDVLTFKWGWPAIPVFMFNSGYFTSTAIMNYGDWKLINRSNLQDKKTHNRVVYADRVTEVLVSDRLLPERFGKLSQLVEFLEKNPC